MRGPPTGAGRDLACSSRVALRTCRVFYSRGGRWHYPLVTVGALAAQALPKDLKLFLTLSCMGIGWMAG